MPEQYGRLSFMKIFFADIEGAACGSPAPLLNPGGHRASACSPFPGGMRSLEQAEREACKTAQSSAQSFAQTGPRRTLDRFLLFEINAVQIDSDPYHRSEN